MKPLIPYDSISFDIPEKKYPGQIFPTLDEYSLRKDPVRTGKAKIMQLEYDYIIDEISIHRNILTTRKSRACLS